MVGMLQAHANQDNPVPTPTYSFDLHKVSITFSIGPTGCLITQSGSI